MKPRRAHAPTGQPTTLGASKYSGHREAPTSPPSSPEFVAHSASQAALSGAPWAAPPNPTRPGQATDALTDDDGTDGSAAKKERFLGHMWKVSRGVAEPIPSARKAEYRTAMARTGIYITGTDLDPVWDRRLHLATGYEICDLAADVAGGDR